MDIQVITGIRKCDDGSVMYKGVKYRLVKANGKKVELFSDTKSTVLTIGIVDELHIPSINTAVKFKGVHTRFT
jgi:hypothetical protein